MLVLLTHSYGQGEQTNEDAFGTGLFHSTIPATVC
jgi:hypothetical protein